jgi:hypothetical protein
MSFRLNNGLEHYIIYVSNTTYISIYYIDIMVKSLTEIYL